MRYLAGLSPEARRAELAELTDDQLEIIVRAAKDELLRRARLRYAERGSKKPMEPWLEKDLEDWKGGDA